MYQKRVGFSLGGPITPQVKLLLIIMGSIFLLQLAMGFISADLVSWFNSLFGISHAGVFGKFYIWQPLTYMFLHGGFLHILFNGLALWMFGSELERLWGEKRFIRYFILSGVGAGICIAIVNYLLYAKNGNPFVVTLGASGAIYALLLAYGMIWPERQIYIWGIIPIKMKYFVLIFGLMEFFGTINSIRGVGGRISHIAHFGGLVVGFLLMRFGSQVSNPAPFSSIQPHRINAVSDFFKKKRVEKKRDEIDKRIRAKAIIDRMLEKIAQSGLESLTAEERRDLEWARKNYFPGGSDTIH
jgi:membrane associated rhomboid family serine protease